MAYYIEFAASVKAHLDALTARQRTTVLDAVERQLANEPTKETRNRKPLKPNPVAPWELRVGVLRVFYEVTEGHRPSCGFSLLASKCERPSELAARRSSCEDHKTLNGVENTG